MIPPVQLPDPPSKQERYFSGMPLQQDPNKPLPGEMPAGVRATFLRGAVALGIFALGLIIGLGLGPEAPEVARERIEELEEQLGQARAKIQELNRTLKYKGVQADNPQGVLAAKDRSRHELMGRQYAAAIRGQNAQAASELVEWFVNRWNQLLDRPEPDDLYERRAQLLSQLIGAMRINLDPGDYAAWQAEFLGGNWLGDLHFDLDGDGYPTKRKSRNPKYNFHNRSVCEIAMVINQWVNNAQVLMQPAMRCDSPKALMSVVLQGPTLNDAISEFVKALLENGYRVSDKNYKGVRLVLVAPPK